MAVPPSSNPPGRPAPPKTSPIGSSITQIDLRHVLVILRAHLIPALAIVIVVCSLVVWQEVKQVKLYSAQSALLVDQQDRILDNAKQVVDTSFDNESQIATRLEQMRSVDVVERVVKSLTPAERTLVMAPYYKDAPPPITNDQAVQGIVRGGLSVERQGKTNIISVRVTHRDPDAAALLANRFAEEIVDFLYYRNSEGNEKALTFLTNQAEELRKKVETDERDLQAYRQKENLVSLEDSQNIVVDRLKAIDSSATQAQIARLAIESRLKQAEAVLKNNSDAAQLASITEFNSLTAVQSQIDDLKAKRVVLAETYGRRHPLMVENQQSIEALQRLRTDRIQAALVELRNQRDNAVAQENQLKAELEDAQQQALKLDQVGVEYNVLRRTSETDQATYSQMLTRLNEATITSQLETVHIKVSEHATPSRVPISPNPRRTMLITLALAAIILLGYPFTVELLFARVRSWADVEYYLGSTLLGEIGSVNRVIEGDRPHLVEKDQDEEAMEQFRALYSQLQLSSKIDPPKSILVTSTVPGEGKSFIASNLAAVFVAHGRKVLLIDCDLRRPSQHRNYKVDNKAGILRWLENGGTLTDDLLRDERLGILEIVPGLSLLRTGGSSRKASELMQTGHLTGLLTALQQKFDILILDTPPAGIFPDSLAFAKVAQELIYICRFNTVSRQQARGVLQRLRQTGLDFPGVVLNDLPTGRGGAYYYYGYGYYHSKYYAKYYKEAQKA